MGPDGQPEKRSARGVSEAEPPAEGKALWRLVLRVAPEVADIAGAMLVEEGAGGAVQEELPHEARVACFGESQQELERLAKAVTKRLRDHGVRVAARVGRAPRAFDTWRTQWTDRLTKVRISDTLWLAPTNAPGPRDDPAGVVWLEPALAFGFGDHPTTRMAALEVERHCRAGARRVLDFGSGSGVLALVAVRSGATRAVGLDVDRVAVDAARRNAVLNRAGARCRFSDGGLGRLRSSFDLAVANVDCRTLLDQASALAGKVAPEGTLLLTGVLSTDARELGRRYRKEGFVVARRKREGDWVLLVLRRP